MEQICFSGVNMETTTCCGQRVRVCFKCLITVVAIQSIIETLCYFGQETTTDSACNHELPVLCYLRLPNAHETLRDIDGTWAGHGGTRAGHGRDTGGTHAGHGGTWAGHGGTWAGHGRDMAGQGRDMAGHGRDMAFFALQRSCRFRRCRGPTVSLTVHNTGRLEDELTPRTNTNRQAWVQAAHRGALESLCSPAIRTEPSCGK